MSLYRTWRPKTFGELVGQDAVVRTLRTALSSGKLAHAYLFSGPRGCGKTSAAKIFARCIDCVNGPTPDPDNTCANCTAILTGSALDVLEIDAASNRGIDDIRALRESVKFAPASMRYKVFIIDEAHMLTGPGANAFLKTLEEPPPYVVFILATTLPDLLPPTILSRCQRYAFRRIALPAMLARLREVADAEHIAIDDGALGAIAYRADGGLRDALTMLEQVASFADGPIAAATVDAAFGSTGREFARRLLGAILAGDAAAALRVVDEASDGGIDMTGLIRGTVAEYRNLLLARVDPGLLADDLAQEDAEDLTALAASTRQPTVVLGLRLLADALAAARFSGNPRLELETAILRLVVQPDDLSLEALATRVTSLEGLISGDASAGLGAARLRTGAAARALPESSRPAPAGAGAGAAARRDAAPEAAFSQATFAPVTPDLAAHAPGTTSSETSASFGQAVAPGPAAAPASESAAAPPTLTQVRALWEQVRKRVQDQYAPLRAPLSRATLDALDGGVLTITTVDSNQESYLRDKVHMVEAALADVLRMPLKVLVRSGGAPAGHARSSAHRAPPPSTGTIPGEGETDLMAYAREKLGGPQAS